MTVATATETATGREKLRDPAWQVFMLLRTVLAIAPLVTGVDKFFNLITYWPKYLAPVATDIAPLGGQPFMYVVGVLEIALGLLVLTFPRYGAPMLSAWLAFIIVNLLLVGGYLDVALRDFGLSTAAVALFLLTVYRTPRGAVDEQENRHV